MESKKDSNYASSEKKYVKQSSYNKVRIAMQTMQVDLVKHLEAKLTETVREVLREVEHTENSLNGTALKENGNHNNRKKSDKLGTLPDKLFLPRNSLLADLFQTTHGQAIYNVFLVVPMILFLNTAIDDIVAGTPNLGLYLIGWSFGELHTGCLIWLCMVSCSFTLYGVFYMWANYRTGLIPNSVLLKAWDYFWFVALIAYQACFLYFPARYVIQVRLPPATSMAVVMEQIRMIMKSHAFVRSNASRALSYKPHETQDGSPCPGFSHFLYFFFCPSLVYRDSYPRTKSIRWGYVAVNYLHVIGIIFLSCYMFERYFVPNYRDYGKKHITSKDMTALVFGAMVPCMLTMTYGFYLLLHAWLNATAEMLRFADRMFYQDWWNAKSYGAFHRKWNIVIHDWVYIYIYKDICENFCPGRRFVPTLAVFAVSAIVHEYVLALTFGFFYPVMLLCFGVFGLALVVITSDKNNGGNILVLLCQFMGTGVMGSLYLMEWYSRVNCVQTRNDFSDFFVPRTWTCIPIQSV